MAVGSIAMDTLLSRLKSVQPAKVRVWTGDESRDVAVPARRRKWASVIEVVEQLGWTRCELLDRSGATLALVENDGAPTSLEVLGDGGGRLGELRQLGELIVRAQERALHFRDAETRTMLTAMTDVIRAMSTANSELARIFRLATQAVGMGAAAAADARHAGDRDRDDPMMHLAAKMLLGDDVKHTPERPAERSDDVKHTPERPAERKRKDKSERPAERTKDKK